MTAYVHFDGMTWPRADARLMEIEHKLRYPQFDQPTQEDLLVAASILSAYRQLVLDTEPKRRRVIRELRKATTR